MADAKMLKKVPVREQDPKVRATNFEEVCLGYNQEEAMEEAQRCLGCKKPKCVEGCPVSINIPGFIEHIKEGNMEEAYKVIGLSSALPAICGRVCPQESQCEGQCIRGKKGEAVSIGKLERFVADYALEHDIKPAGAEVKNGHKVAVIGSGPSGLTLQRQDTMSLYSRLFMSLAVFLFTVFRSSVFRSRRLLRKRSRRSKSLALNSRQTLSSVNPLPSIS